MSLVASPIAVSSTRKWAKRFIVPAVALAGVGAYFTFLRPARPGPAAAAGKFLTVQPVDLDVKVKKDGELQAVNNIDIVCMVEGLNTLVQIVKEGSFVKKGEVIVQIDSSLIRQKIDDTSIDLQRAQADVETSRQLREIQDSQNDANLKAAAVSLELAKIAQKQYIDGLYPQQLADDTTAVKMADITLKNKKEDLAQTRGLFAKGFVTAADVKQAELAVTTCENDLSKAKTALEVLTRYSHEMDLRGKESYAVQCEQALGRTKKENAINLRQKQVDLDTKEEALRVVTRKFAHLKEQLAACTIAAPADGLVVYASTPSGSGQPLEQGAQVRERQALLRLPDTSAMKAVLRVNESQVTHLRAGLRAVVSITGVAEPVGATLEKISPVADSSQRWWNPDLREYPVELTLDNTPANLKPGISVKGEVYVDRLSDVVAVPLAALYTEKSNSYVFIRNGEDIKPAAVKVGETNETLAQLLEGLAAGDQVLLLEAGQGRDLLDKAGIHIEAPSDRKRRADEKRPGIATATKEPVRTASVEH
ncbi:MAG: efflux transporter, family, subunit [Phycisphaerales bacterium]|nr:efflux transporter, family, subunit [Phycisphaerales bacterium]MDB5305644.1 efflux transporter, family, subunit [Phycisphaerales bacterium]